MAEDALDITVALDIGGSSVKWGWRHADHDVLELVVGGVITIDGRDFEAVQVAVDEAIAQAGTYGTIRHIGISTTGSVDRDGVVIHVGHFSGYDMINWRDRLMAQYPELVDVRVVNDGRAAAWSEYLAAQTIPAEPSQRTHVHVVVGTGVGGGIIMGGQFLLGDAGHAGYLGHMTVAQSSDIPCSCGKYGHLEAVAAVPAIRHAWNGDTNLVGGLGDIAAAVAAGDPHATQVLFDAGRRLGTGIAGVMSVLNPSVVTVGGGVLVMSAGVDDDPYFDGINQGIYEQAHHRVRYDCHLRRGLLGNDAGLIGAGLLFNQ